jgi:hypothetical protein
MEINMKGIFLKERGMERMEFLIGQMEVYLMEHFRKI